MMTESRLTSDEYRAGLVRIGEAMGFLSSEVLAACALFGHEMTRTRPRDRNWIEVSTLSSASRVQIDAHSIKGEPLDGYTRHTPPGDHSGQLWLPGAPEGTFL